ncbi:hypothetical protein N7509_013986 [Penicillium cosmopolitanum]|uniref:Uncharacterized protein n=1 Tax=Penicillium cosmopolitanum TaxID=1131564 RepID=A0A9W9SFL2_9EURO|nr:uncharacterized protein N7509_013986 [Penicillium cosmopolitanum]KAJ5377100.1 hypothetical protein N7509_013986 [Penicillium cosmopolitanum]
MEHDLSQTPGAKIHSLALLFDVMEISQKRFFYEALQSDGDLRRLVGHASVFDNILDSVSDDQKGEEIMDDIMKSTIPRALQSVSFAFDNDEVAQTISR